VQLRRYSAGGVRALKTPPPMWLLRGCCLTLAAALSLGGCANYLGLHAIEPLSQPQQLQTGVSLKGAGGNWPSSDWVRQFGDEQLVALTAEALANNPDIRGARARIVAAQAQAEGARGATLPTASLAADADRSYVYQDIGLQTPAGPTQPGSSWSNSGQAFLALSYDLDLWGRGSANLARSISQAKAAQAQAQQARLSLTVAMVSSYNQLAQQYATRDVIEQLALQRDGMNRLSATRYKAGLDSDLERTQSAQSAAETHTQLAQLDEQILLTRYQIGSLLGQGPDRGLSVARPRLGNLPAPKLPDNVPLDLLGRRPDIVVARWQVEAADQQTRAAKARFYPDINLSAFAGYASFGLSDLGSSYAKGFGAGPAITLPIFEGGQLRANLKGEYAQYDAAVANYNQTLNTALTDVADQIASIRATERQSESQAQAMQQSGHAYALMQQRYRAGLASELTLLNAQAAMLGTRQHSIDLESRRRALQVALINSLGGGFDAAAAHLAPEAPRGATR
jgi:NodT family efflux transporter outer membrane factor (OMF) lipoprotein